MAGPQNFTEKHRAAVARYAAETSTPDREIAEIAFAEGLYGIEFPKKPSTSSVQSWRGRRVTADDVNARCFVILDSILTIEIAKRTPERQISIISQVLGATAKRPGQKLPPLPKPGSGDETAEETAPSLERLRESLKATAKTSTAKQENGSGELDASEADEAEAGATEEMADGPVIDRVV